MHLFFLFESHSSGKKKKREKKREHTEIVITKTHSGQS